MIRKTVIIIAAVIALFFILTRFYKVPLDLLRPSHAQIINRYAAHYGFDPLFITALINEESGFLMRARSGRGAVGLMQLMPATARELADELEIRNFSDRDLENPEINIRLGTYYLYKLRREFSGSEVLTLAAYNAGMNKVQYWLRLNPLIGSNIQGIPYRETRNYVKDTLQTYRWLKSFQKIKKTISGAKA
jgi:soluble lytic murein transglycosylase